MKDEASAGLSFARALLRGASGLEPRTGEDSPEYSPSWWSQFVDGLAGRSGLSVDDDSHSVTYSSKIEYSRDSPDAPAGDHGTVTAERPAVADDSASSNAAAPTTGIAGYRGPVACQVVGITYRMLDYWARTKLLAPSIRVSGSGRAQRLYSFKDLVLMRVVKTLLDTGVSLNNIRIAIDRLRLHTLAELASLTVLSDGESVYEATSPTEVGDILASGKGVFGVAVGALVSELEESVARFGGEIVDAYEEVSIPEAGRPRAQWRREA